VCRRGIDPRDIGGFSSYSDDRIEASQLGAALGTRQLRTATMQWGRGGDGCWATMANAAASIDAGLGRRVVFRLQAQGQYGCFGQTEGAIGRDDVGSQNMVELPSKPQNGGVQVDRTDLLSRSRLNGSVDLSVERSRSRRSGCFRTRLGYLKAWHSSVRLRVAGGHLAVFLSRPQTSAHHRAIDIDFSDATNSDLRPNG